MSLGTESMPLAGTMRVPRAAAVGAELAARTRGPAGAAVREARRRVRLAAVPDGAVAVRCGAEACAKLAGVVDAARGRAYLEGAVEVAQAAVAICGPKVRLAPVRVGQVAVPETKGALVDLAHAGATHL